jgi:CHASE1-domain containing sensor protein
MQQTEENPVPGQAPSAQEIQRKLSVAQRKVCVAHWPNQTSSMATTCWNCGTVLLRGLAAALVTTIFQTADDSSMLTRISHCTTV